MNTKLKNIEINPAFENLFVFQNDDEKIEHEAQMISYRILSEIEKLCDDKKIKKKDLANMVGTSKSYITQLFNGTKSINTYIMAKFENALDITFEIHLKDNMKSYNDIFNQSIKNELLIHLNVPKVKWSYWQKENLTEDIVNKLKTENDLKQVA